jgi:hypothetical protein
MPSARELLEQADALMRKNRKRGDGDIPMLTDAVEVAIVPVSMATPALAPGPAPAPVPAPALVPVALPVDVPLLTDAVDEVVIDFEPLPAPPAALGAIMEGDPSDWLVMDTIDPASHSITGRGPDTLAVVPPMTLKAAGSAATPPPMGSQPRDNRPPPLELWPSSPPATSVHAPVSNPPAATVPAPAATVRAAPAEIAPATTMQAPTEIALVAAVHAPTEDAPAATVDAPATSLPAAIAHVPTERAPAAVDEEHWRALAEQISMQVLQRLDLFTDSGLKEQLARRLEPIVERASAELVGEITEHVGRLVRTYVSEAIEREIAQWKRDQQ